MLSKKEKLVMRFILENCLEKDTCLLSPLDIAHSLEPRYNVKDIEIKVILDGLVQENYISLVNSDKNGSLVYCISVLAKGKAFIREQANAKKNLTLAIVRTIGLAIISFIVGIILKAIFS